MPEPHHGKCLDADCRNPATWCGFCVTKLLTSQLAEQRQHIAAYLANNPAVPGDAIEGLLNGEFKYATGTVIGEA